MADVFHLHYRALLNEQGKKKSSLLKIPGEGEKSVAFLMHELALIIFERLAGIVGDCFSYFLQTC